MADENKEINGKKCVLVTGASGYIALHCVQQLLEAGYEVRGTVRSLCDPEKVGPLRDLKYSADRLELVEADLECAEHWPDAVRGCTYILHVASPWQIVADEGAIATARDGTLNVLRAAADSRTVQKVVLTSSCAAINDGHKNKSRVFNESCWADLNSKRIENYAKSKAVAEKAAWDFWNSLPERSRFELTVLNPTFVTGPVLSGREHGSATVIKRMMDYRTFPAIPKISLGVVDVRDVAGAHLKALKAPNTNGERILITAVPSVWFSQMAEWLHKEFKKQGYVISRLAVPNWLVKLYAKANVDPHVAALKYRFGSELRFDNTKSKMLLGMDYILPEKSIVDMAYSMIDHGMIKQKPKQQRSKSVDVSHTTMTDNKADNKEISLKRDSDELIIIDHLNNIKTSLPDLYPTKEIAEDQKSTSEQIPVDHENDTEQILTDHQSITNQNNSNQTALDYQEDIKQNSQDNRIDANKIMLDVQKDTEEDRRGQNANEQNTANHQDNAEEALDIPSNGKKQIAIEKNGTIPVTVKAN